jgi:ketosteroid isomerase-like protein
MYKLSIGTLFITGILVGQVFSQSPTRARFQSPSTPTKLSSTETQEAKPTPAKSAETTKKESTTSEARPRTAKKSLDKTKVKASMADPTPSGVIETFKALFEGIRNADVDTVMSIYWESPQLILFNNNGTITRTWEQTKANRTRIYSEIKDIKLEERDLNIQMIGREGAVVTCLWTQTDTVRGTPETSSGRLTLVFRRIEGAWKVIHAHTSPLAPNPAGLAPSERNEIETKPESKSQPEK